MRAIKNIIFLTMIVVLSSMNYSEKKTVTLEITDIRNNDGQICLAIFKDEQSFKKSKPIYAKKYKKAKVKDGKMLVKLNMTPGIYGISILDDENGNSKMDYSFFGIPTEGYAFGNFFHKGFSKPKFDDFKFELKSDINMEAKMRYL